MRGETVDELTGFARAMRERVVPVSAPDGAIDTCGTGGDGSKTFNISTAVSTRCRGAAGVPVAKHGNRAMSSATGSADVLEALGIPIDLDADDAAEAIVRDGFAFLFAPSYHPAMRHAGPVRRELGVPTAFNLLGPMTNPAGVRRQVIGVADPNAAAKVAHVLHHLGTERAFVVHGDGVDELPLDGSGVAYDVFAHGRAARRIDSTLLGLASASSSELRGGDAAQNAAIIEAVLDGEPGAHGATSCFSTPALRFSSSGRAVPTCATASRWPSATIDSGGRGRRCSSGCGKHGPRRARHDSRAAASSTRSPRVARQISLSCPRRDSRAGRGRVRDLLGALARPGLHVIAEVKRRSPSSATLARTTTSSRERVRTSAAAQRRSPCCASRTGSTARSTICALSGAPSASRSWPRTSSCPPSSSRCCATQVPTSCCCSPCSMTRTRSRRSSREARSLGMEPLVEAHDAA